MMVGGLFVGVVAVTWALIAGALQVPSSWAAGIGVPLGLVAAFAGIYLDVLLAGGAGDADPATLMAAVRPVSWVT